MKTTKGKEGSGLPNRIFGNQGFFNKNQEFIRRFCSKNQEKNQETFLST
jgi:hypothetical protein